MEKRIKLLFFFFLIGFFLVIVKLFYWQVAKNKRFTNLANQQYVNQMSIPAERGKILSRDGFPLVLNTKTFLLYGNPRELKITPAEVSRQLEPILTDNLLNLDRLSDKNLFWVPLAKNLDGGAEEKVVALNINGLGFEEQSQRFYPEASLSAQLLGFVGEDKNNEKKGYFGLEGFYENELKGTAGIKVFDQDGLGRPMPLSQEAEEKEIPGRDLFLNLDRALQFLVEQNLRKGIEKYQATAGSVVIMDPGSGAVLAMASFPNYEPDRYFSYDQELFKNPVISSPFEPGSVFKVFVMASALDAGVVKLEDNCSFCAGPRNIASYTIKTWNEKYYPNSSLTDIIVHSDNVGMVWVGERLGTAKLLEYLQKFGFDKKTNIDLQGEAEGNLKTKEKWQAIDLATATFGQGIAVTPIQILTAVAAIANQGILYQPEVVKKIFDDKKVFNIEPLKKGRAISQLTAKQVTEMMVQAVEKGEAKWAKPKGYRIAGKTGTAQIPITGHYDPEKTIASFVGFAPADKPRFAMLVILSEPKLSPWGSETAAPLWFAIAKDIFRLWGIKPTEN